MSKHIHDDPRIDCPACVEWTRTDPKKCNDKWCCMHGEECQKIYKHGLTCHTHTDLEDVEKLLKEME